MAVQGLAFVAVCVAVAAANPVIIVACGGGFGACTSAAEVTQMRAVLQGLDVEIVRLDWGGTKFEPAWQLAQQTVAKVKTTPDRKVLFAGRSAGGWLAAYSGARPRSNATAIDGSISLYGPLDLPTLWQNGQWGKLNSPRGPLLFMMPWGIPGCTNCNMSFPEGDSWFWNVNDEKDPKNHPKMADLNIAGPFHFLTSASSPFFVTQGSEDGIIGQYKGLSQSRRAFTKLGGRRQDQLVDCPGLPHGYGFDEPCIRAALRNWICATLRIQPC